MDGKRSRVDDHSRLVRIQQQDGNRGDDFAAPGRQWCLRGPDGRDSCFYDPDAFVAPLRSTMGWNRTQKLDSPNLRHTFIECLSNVVNVDGGPPS
jgi:hypothetical protein